MTEFAAAARMAEAIIETGSDPVVLLVAGAARLPVHRHALPTQAALGSRAMLVACARRHGLIANLTRFVAFAPLGPRDADRYERLLRVDVAYNRATRPGVRVGDACRAGVEAFAEHGFDPNEWHLHHQGGPTGYEGRDYLANVASSAAIEESQAFAWNPSVPSLKSEDTILAGGEVLTVDPAWPAVEVDRMTRPLVLER
jgi:antitoxin VapB